MTPCLNYAVHRVKCSLVLWTRWAPAGSKLCFYWYFFSHVMPTKPSSSSPWDLPHPCFRQNSCLKFNTELSLLQVTWNFSLTWVCSVIMQTKNVEALSRKIMMEKLWEDTSVCSVFRVVCSNSASLIVENSSITKYSTIVQLLASLQHV